MGRVIMIFEDDDEDGDDIGPEDLAVGHLRSLGLNLSVEAMGMEDETRPFIVLQINGQTYYLLDRLNEKGKHMAQLYDGTGTNEKEVRAEFLGIAEKGKGLSRAALIKRGITVDAVKLRDALNAALMCVVDGYGGWADRRREQFAELLAQQQASVAERLGLE